MSDYNEQQKEYRQRLRKMDPVTFLAEMEDPVTNPFAEVINREALKRILTLLYILTDIISWSDVK